ncbi:RagB/SusD family nutrient uptake outer membrane protein [Dysgonomonas sp. Marseille-P4677]|uniref:RagB/SusD family nutrient uptake outer membrane protein n=1 Tax=Dysgonomonas sp. Marseille-P4677 TaxID=2364790 RepID=UPI0019129A8C|nr:RagB/SusD family nutrient uptake outer membrane protein [Dysgonomonas sp. Marseille-P4677]MBK5722926.1 RagB/SusD family nutrient uptake outer membrane protein [Dysgonomonas sp. Marseille-P4677]
MTSIRYIYRIIILTSVIFLVTGCDFLETKIDTDMTPEAVETNRGTLWSFANAMYSPMSSGFVALDGNFFAAASDEAQRTQESGNAFIFNRGILSPDNVEIATSYIYQNCYEGIRAANFFLDFAENGEALLALNRDIERDKINYERDLRNLAWFRAEAHILKAYYYSELIKRFGGVVIVETTIEKDPNPGKIARSSYDEVVTYIVNLIDTYKESLQVSWKDHPDNISTNDGRFELKSALALKARVLLYAASPLNNSSNDKTKWEKAAKAAHDVIAEMQYTMPENRNYGNYFVGNNATGSKESILLRRDGTSNTIEKANYPITFPGGNSGVTPTENLVSSYEYIGAKDPVDPYKNRDPRLAATVVYNGSMWNGRQIDQSPGGEDDMKIANTSKTGYYTKKFLKEGLNLIQGGTEVHVFPIFRYAEVLLNYAEAMNQAYGPDAIPSGYTMSARQALMQVRKSASTSLSSVVTTSPEEFLKAVKHERRVELAFEDHRYWDLLRWKDAEDVLNKPIKGVVITKDENGIYSYQTVDVAKRVFHKRNYLMPFSRAEIVNSENILKQNEGY